MFETVRIPARTPITAGILSPSMRATLAPALKGGGSPTILTNRPPMGTRSIAASPSVINTVFPSSIAMASAGGTRNVRTGITLGLPIGGAESRAGILPSTTLATTSVFGGNNAGMGPSSLSSIGSSVSSAGVSIMNTFGALIPLAIKVILAVIVVKIVLWLIKGRKR